jgi:hypothetical protein
VGGGGSPRALSQLSSIPSLAVSLFSFSPSFTLTLHVICSPSPPSSCLISGIPVFALFSCSSVLVSFSSSLRLLPLLALPSGLPSISSIVPLAGPGGMSLSSPAILSPSAFPSAAGAGVVTGAGVDGVVMWRASVTRSSRSHVVVVSWIAGMAVLVGVGMIVVVVVVVVVVVAVLAGVGSEVVVVVEMWRTSTAGSAGCEGGIVSVSRSSSKACNFTIAFCARSGNGPDRI